MSSDCQSQTANKLPEKISSMQAARHPANEQARSRSHKRNPPWKSPCHCLWLVTALLLSGWLTVSMPDTQQVKSASRTQTVMHRGDGLAAVPDTSAQRHTGIHATRQTDTDALTRLERRARMFGRLFLFVGIGAFLGSIIEGRCWYRIFASTLGRLVHAARLPDIVAISLPTAFASSAAADSMLVASRDRGEISNSTLIAGGMLNSFIAHFSHSLRVMYPVLAALGLTGVLYFIIQLSGGAFIAFGVVMWHRFLVARKENSPSASFASDKVRYALQAMHDPLPWKETARKGSIRALTLLFRLTCLSVPMILATEWLVKTGALNFWHELVPRMVSQTIPEQTLTIMAAQIGGLVQSATVSAGLLENNLITAPEVLLAMLISSAASNPIRTLRRNLPTALAIFPPRIALIIVIGMQLIRFCVVVIAVALLIFWMQG